LQDIGLLPVTESPALDNLASWADPAFGGNHGIAESVNLAIDF